MVKVYVSLCEKGKKNFYDIPEKLQDEARSLIEADGYQINEDGTVIKKPSNE